MTLPCPHLDQLERSEDHVNSWHRPRRRENSPGFGPKHKHFATAAIFDTAGKPHTAGRTFGVPISRITYARRRRGPHTFGVPFSRITIAAASWRYRTWIRQPTRDAEDHRKSSRRLGEEVLTGVAFVCPEPPPSRSTPPIPDAAVTRAKYATEVPRRRRRQNAHEPIASDRFWDHQ